MAGMQKYMERVQKAKKLKEEKAQLEDKVFNKGKNWTPSVTQPNAPKITAKRNQYLTGAAPDEFGYAPNNMAYNSHMNPSNPVSGRGSARPKSGIRQPSAQGMPNNAANRQNMKQM